MSDLADFLLARIAEDEEVARAAVALRERYMDDRIISAYQWAWHTEMPSTGGGGTQFLRGAPSPDRILAECDAKREIVTECARLEASNAEPPEALQLVDVVLQQLALPYADHEDFREEWRP